MPSCARTGARAALRLPGQSVETAAETAFFYHPAVWWISRQIRREGEHCCDDAAVAACGNAVSLAQALSSLEQARAVGRLELAAVGSPDAAGTLDRVRRIVGLTPRAVVAGGMRTWMGGILTGVCPRRALAAAPPIVTGAEGIPAACRPLAIVPARLCSNPRIARPGAQERLAIVDPSGLSAPARRGSPGAVGCLAGGRAAGPSVGHCLAHVERPSPHVRSPDRPCRAAPDARAGHAAGPWQAVFL